MSLIKTRFIDLRVNSNYGLAIHYFILLTQILQEEFWCKALKTPRIILKHDLKEADAVQYI